MRWTSGEKPIVAITPNPTLDLGGVVDRILPDEKNYVHEETRFPGGNAINAARIIHRLGVPVEVSGFLGGGIGNEVRELIGAEGLRQDFIPIRGSTRISVTVSNRANHHQTRLSFAGPRVSRTEFEVLLSYLDRVPPGTLVVIGGSLPPGLSGRHLVEMLNTIGGNRRECVLDVPGPLLRDAALARIPPLLIKPNLIEFSQYLGREVSSLNEVITAAQEVLSRIPLICVSSVAGGAVLVSSHGAWFGRTPAFEIRTTVGAGDSMVGAMCARLRQWDFVSRHDPRFTECLRNEGPGLLRWGLAAACATLSVAGTQLGKADDIRRFLSKIHVDQASAELSRFEPSTLAKTS